MPIEPCTVSRKTSGAAHHSNCCHGILNSAGALCLCFLVFFFSIDFIVQVWNIYDAMVQNIPN
jgi:hypothetical protein